jgi:hypothetical protein
VPHVGVREVRPPDAAREPADGTLDVPVVRAQCVVIRARVDREARAHQRHVLAQPLQKQEVEHVVLCGDAVDDVDVGAHDADAHVVGQHRLLLLRARRLAAGALRPLVRGVACEVANAEAVFLALRAAGDRDPERALNRGGRRRIARAVAGDDRHGQLAQRTHGERVRGTNG